jgi:hypothetical protein
MYAAMPDSLRDRLVRLPRDPDPRRKPISAALLDVAEPWIREARESGMAPDAYIRFAKTVCTIAVYAWNLTLIEDIEERDAEMDGVLEVVGEAFNDNYRAVVAWAEMLVAMMDRVMDRYAEDMRPVAGYEFDTNDNGDPRLHAVCLLPESEAPEDRRSAIDLGVAGQVSADTTALGERPAARIVELNNAAKNSAPSEVPGSRT